MEMDGISTSRVHVVRGQAVGQRYTTLLSGDRVDVVGWERS
jgi:hypothetical protein